MSVKNSLRSRGEEEETLKKSERRQNDKQHEADCYQVSFIDSPFSRKFANLMTEKISGDPSPVRPTTFSSTNDKFDGNLLTEGRKMTRIAA